MGAPGLAALQRGLQRCVLGEGDDIAAAVSPGPGPGVEDRLGIYRFAYRARLADSLRDSYGHTARYLGANAFDKLAHAYLAEHPSRHANLRWYGDDFAPWLALRHSALPEVAELAALDWALRRAFDAPDVTPISLSDLGAIAPDDWPCVRLRPGPSAGRLRVHHNTIAIWHALDTDVAPPPPFRLPEGVEVLVWRRGLQPHFRSIAPLESAALDALLAGETFGTTCAALAGRFPGIDVAREAGTLLRRWVDEELLAGPGLAAA